MVCVFEDGGFLADFEERMKELREDVSGMNFQNPFLSFVASSVANNT